MSTVTIFRFTMYDITTDTNRRSHRWGTRAGIESVGGKVDESTAITVDESAVESDISGLTVRDFDPNRRVGFQTQVRS